MRKDDKTGKLSISATRRLLRKLPDSAREDQAKNRTIEDNTPGSFGCSPTPRRRSFLAAASNNASGISASSTKKTTRVKTDDDKERLATRPTKRLATRKREDWRQRQGKRTTTMREEEAKGVKRRRARLEPVISTDRETTCCLS
jgi:hypothetical protein